MTSTGYLSADELAELVECKPNQRTKMADWLTRHKWKFEIGATGLPRVARAYHDRKMGVTEEKLSTKYAEEPNRHAFSQEGANRH